MEVLLGLQVRNQVVDIFLAIGSGEDFRFIVVQCFS